MEIRILCDDMYAFGHISTPSVETSSKELEKINSYFTKNLKIKIKCDENALSWKNWIRYELSFFEKKWVISIAFANSMTQRLVTVHGDW